MRGQVLAAALFLLLVATTAQGGGPLVVSKTGVPYAWDNSVPIPFSPDQGSLGMMNNAEAVTFVENAFGEWAAIPTANLSFVNAGPLAVDVNTVSEFNSFDGVFNGQNAIIFDADGSLFTALGFSSGVIGFAGPEWITTSAPFQILEGIAALNGKFRDNNLANGELTEDEFFGTFVHEFGHFLNLDHSQVNGHFYIGDTNDPGFQTFGAPTISSVEIMFPFALDGMSSSPKMDDAVAISTLYPAAGFSSSTGAINGSIFRSDGTTLFQGADVIGRNLADPFDDAVSNVSGARFFPGFPFPSGGSPDPALRGLYELNGLTPGASYAVEMVRVNPAFTGGSGVGPLSPPASLPGPEEFYNGAGETGGDPIDDPLDFVSVASVAGAPTTGIDILINGPAPPHDLAVTKIIAPRTVFLSSLVTKRVKVRIQNRSDHSHTIPDLTTLANLVTLQVLPIVVGPSCSPAPIVGLHVGSPQKRLPFSLASKATLDVVFDVTFGCANDPDRGRGHEDYKYIATVDHSALDGKTDSHPDDDTCPHDALATPGHRDPNPDGTIVDRGCGGRKPGGFGADVKTDVVVIP